ncbi:hypothetical protein Pcinc_001568 [Petrolisthes cinctipes]|uniref:C2H2-type domain-containing protein n=1 Tax=Petrolisthes cinctipes TaxID=88211 RepID=A0AAE1L307_PETCI|nr:hypothetical protein Pcinc_023603 [Petrolisthes cinctipes]KAK3894684.1 hypothetical protein Pcinc_001568 [Petrolisthes cinctipes]
MSALESLVGSLGDDNNTVDITNTGVAAAVTSNFTGATHDDPLATHDSDGKLVMAGDISLGCSSSPYTQPSRQRCHCPTCGRMLSQRRNLKQHMITTHKMTPDDATVIVKRYNLELLMDDPILTPFSQASHSHLPSLLPSPPLPLPMLPNITPVSSPCVTMPSRSPLSS